VNLQRRSRSEQQAYYQGWCARHDMGNRDNVPAVLYNLYKSYTEELIDGTTGKGEQRAAGEGLSDVSIKEGRRSGSGDS
jgi:hypothetical protein